MSIEYLIIDRQFLAGSCGSRQRQVADGPMGPM